MSILHFDKATLLEGPVYLAAKCGDQAGQAERATHAPDINPAWYTGRGIRPVGRFGRRRAALRDVTVAGLRCRLSCLPLDGDAFISPPSPDNYQNQVGKTLLKSCFMYRRTRLVLPTELLPSRTSLLTPPDFYG
ncbi:hypothetical protein A6R68_08980 [Neotoma lepida]|uniref:Uncharacterized protein n=1 Tax=Neotoma lepida TaxID=56216 RepID=A0A1A6G123_NEOLE|nr:hypothetical protein A6R68_08980 [Neotoma lepida]